MLRILPLSETLPYTGAGNRGLARQPQRGKPKGVGGSAKGVAVGRGARDCAVSPFRALKSGVKVNADRRNIDANYILCSKFCIKILCGNININMTFYNFNKHMLWFTHSCLNKLIVDFGRCGPLRDEGTLKLL